MELLLWLVILFIIIVILNQKICSYVTMHNNILNLGVKMIICLLMPNIIMLIKL